MKVRCTTKFATKLPPSYIETSPGYSQNMRFDELTVGKEYVVHMLTSWEYGTWYYIDDDAGRWYASTYPAPLFEVIDPKMPSTWRIQVRPDGGIILAFKEYFADQYFYDKLTDARPIEVSSFK